MFYQADVDSGNQGGLPSDPFANSANQLSNVSAYTTGDDNQYDTNKIYEEMMKKLQEILVALKSGKDVSVQLSMLMYKMSEFQSAQVGTDAKAQEIMQGYINDAKDIWQQFQKEMGNIPTEKGDPGQGTNDADFINEVVNHAAKMQGDMYYKFKDLLGKIKNDSFFKSHPDMEKRIEDTINGITDAITSQTTVNIPCNYKDGNGNWHSILYQTNAMLGILMQYEPQKYEDFLKANQRQSGNHDIQDFRIDPTNPTLMNNLTSNMGDLNQNLTSGSSALSALAQSDAKTLEATRSVFKNFCEAFNGIVAHMNQAMAR